MNPREYWQARGGGTKDGFITALYQDTLNRSPDSGGLTAYTKALNVGTSPRQMAAQFVGSTENLQNLVASSYKEFLKRPADTGGVNAYVKAPRAGGFCQKNVGPAN